MAVYDCMTTFFSTAASTQVADCEYHCTFVRLAFDLEFEQTLVLMLIWPTAISIIAILVT